MVKTMTKLIHVILIFSLAYVVRSDRTLNTFKILHASGPEAIAFDLTGQGPYTGVSDGRVLKYEGPGIGFVEFAHASPLRTKEKCDGTDDPNLGPICGRPFGVGFNYRTGELYIADAFFGLCKVGPDGGLAEQLATSAEGGPFKWLDGLDVDSTTEMVYFTDISTKYTFRELPQALSSGDSTGRLMSYNPKTKEVQVLLSGLQIPGGTGVSRDGSFVLVSEYTGHRILKYWLKGPKANTAEAILSIHRPDNIKRTLLGDFWIGANLIMQQPAPNTIPQGVRINESGKVLETINLDGIFRNETIAEVQEFAGSYYVVSIRRNSVGICKCFVEENGRKLLGIRYDWIKENCS
ncbi:strictosidine synthase [Coffea arabica]|nr:strictosidine synthase-like [Coffea arabica]